MVKKWVGQKTFFGEKIIKLQKLYTSTWLNLNYGTSGDQKCEEHRDGGIYQ